MATPQKYDFTVKANGYWTRVWQIKNNGVPLDITSYSFEMSIKKSRGAAGTPYLDLAMGTGIEIEDAALGKIRISIEPDATIDSTVKYQYDLLAVIDSKPYVWLYGTITFEPGVSYLE
jgi:hypothetical protein